MSRVDQPVSPPVENTTPRDASPSSEQWIMKGLNDLRDDLKEIKKSLSSMDERLGALEKRVMRAVYTLAGAVAVLALIYTGFTIAEKYVDISITPKVEAN